MNKIFKKIKNRIRCFLGHHHWVYLWGNYQTGKNLFECKNCGKRIEV
jgi:hypothetical protein